MGISAGGILTLAKPGARIYAGIRPSEVPTIQIRRLLLNKMRSFFKSPALVANLYYFETGIFTKGPVGSQVVYNFDTNRQEMSDGTRLYDQTVNHIPGKSRCEFTPEYFQGMKTTGKLKENKEIIALLEKELDLSLSEEEKSFLRHFVNENLPKTIDNGLKEYFSKVVYAAVIEKQIITTRGTGYSDFWQPDSKLNLEAEQYRAALTKQRLGTTVLTNEVREQIQAKITQILDKK